ncbi:MAG: hypothetical protein ACREML_00120 [Vulcanimicrobiaceae bacterium]
MVKAAEVLQFCGECGTSWDPEDPAASHEDWCSHKGKAPEPPTREDIVDELDDLGTPPTPQSASAAETEEEEIHDAVDDEVADDEERTVRTTVDGREAEVVIDGTDGGPKQEKLVILTLPQALDKYHSAEDSYERAHRVFTAAKDAHKTAASALEMAKLDVIEAADRERNPTLAFGEAE